VMWLREVYKFGLCDARDVSWHCGPRGFTFFAAKDVEDARGLAATMAKPSVTTATKAGRKTIGATRIFSFL
jgi:hypothetical protein